MGIGPWAQGELMRGVQKTERARFRRILKAGWKELDQAMGLGQPSHVMAKRTLNPSSAAVCIKSAFTRMSNRITPKKRVEKPKKEDKRCRSLQP